MGALVSSPSKSHPSYIQLPTNQLFGTINLSPSRDNPPSPLDSPALQFYTAPSTPESGLIPPVDIIPPLIPPDPSPQHEIPPEIIANEAYPTTAPDPGIDDLALDDEGLSTLEKIYLFSRSKAVFHRVFIAHALPTLLDHVAPHEAVEYVLPLLSGLAMDEEESVKEALAAELVPIIWWFFTHCQLVQDDHPFASFDSTPVDPPPPTTISAQAFTPILGTLLLSPNTLVGGPARYAVVDVLARIHRADTDQGAEDCGLFGQTERRAFEQEMLQQVVIGMGRLDDGLEDDGGGMAYYEEEIQHGEVNPYFPILPSEVPVANGTIPQIQVVSASPPDPDDWVPRSPSNPTLPRPAEEPSEQGDEQEQAAVGRLSSMSLMAAVTANGSLNEETKNAFVKEVERVGKDEVYWVRREASFALGALAKVVPEEIVVCSLLPLFESLREDHVWHVRHSALFALPALLARLPSSQRRSLALTTILPLAADASAQVRVGVLEALGEIIYAFHGDPGGVPEELVKLFVGRRDEDRRVIDDRQQQLGKGGVHLNNVDSKSHGLSTEETAALDSFFTDPARPLICAFNIPAVALTLGRTRWEADLRALYVELAADRAIKVRRTLAASLGELAKIVGPEYAKMDLVGGWWDAVRCTEDSEVRLKAVECIEVFVSELGKEEREEVIEGLLEVWDTLKGWREREMAAKALVGLVGVEERPQVVRGLLMKALEDDVAAVREAAVSAVPWMWTEFSERRWQGLRDDLCSLAQSGVYRRRMTFVACVETLVAEKPDRFRLDDEDIWKPLTALADDHILGVRIGVARLVGTVCNSGAPSDRVLQLARHLGQDTAREVREYVPTLRLDRSETRRASGSTTFSRPPPITPSVRDPHGTDAGAVSHGNIPERPDAAVGRREYAATKDESQTRSLSEESVGGVHSGTGFSSRRRDVGDGRGVLEPG